MPATIRRQVPRVLKMIPDQRNVDVLLKSIGHPDRGIRVAMLKALNGLQDGAPDLNYGETVASLRSPFTAIEARFGLKTSKNRRFMWKARGGKTLSSI